jgi:hypothetical protein
VRGPGKVALSAPITPRRNYATELPQDVDKLTPQGRATTARADVDIMAGALRSPTPKALTFRLACSGAQCCEPHEELSVDRRVLVAVIHDRIHLLPHRGRVQRLGHGALGVWIAPLLTVRTSDIGASANWKDVIGCGQARRRKRQRTK